MGGVRPFIPVRLVIGLLSTNEESHPKLFSLLSDAFGPILEISSAVPFLFTDYYNQEMGGIPQRSFLVFERLYDPSLLAEAKLITNRIEEQFKHNNSRTINLDPGILSMPNLILATTKNRSHRIPLTKGIYAEVTLWYEKGVFHAFPWSYADYKSDAVRLLFKRYRRDYIAVLKALEE